MVRITMTPHAITMAIIAARSLQFIASLLALATVGAGFSGTSTKGYAYQLGSHEASFLLLVAYSSMMYSAWHLACVEIYPLVARPRKMILRGIDGSLAFFLLVAAIALAASDYVSHCETYDAMLRCSNLKAATAFTFLALVPIGASIALTFVTSTDENELHGPPTGYVVETTPTSAGFSPRPVANAPPTPSSKV